MGFTAVAGIGAVCPVQVTAAISTDAGTKTVGDTKVTIATTSLPVGGANAAYSQKVQATGGVTPYIWRISVGSLPAGLSLNESTGEITDTPIIYGTSQFTVRVTDSQNPAVTATKTLSITINPLALTIITASLPDGAVRAAYSHRVRATGGFIPYTWSISVGSLPAGLSLNASKGIIIGIPTTTGVSQFTVRVTDSQNPAAAVTKVLSIKIEPCISPRLWFSPI